MRWSEGVLIKIATCWVFGAGLAAQDRTRETRLAHLRTLTVGGPLERVSWNAEQGQRLFQANCSGCHIVNGRGGHLGPDLSRIGSSRSASALTNKIRNPSKNIVACYQPIIIVTTDGRRVRGLRKNEDPFSIQIMDVSERLQGYIKSDVSEVVLEQRSVMPEFTAARLSDSDLRDLVSYLTARRGADVLVAER
jgi:putative heme-binding domain-containing protein